MFREILVSPEALLEDALVGVVYGLSDPRAPSRIAYIGMTRSHVLHRFIEHLRDAHRVARGIPVSPSSKVQVAQRRKEKSLWILGLVEAGLLPALSLIERPDRPTQLLRRERDWTIHLQRQGMAWLNCEIVTDEMVNRRIAEFLQKKAAA